MGVEIKHKKLGDKFHTDTSSYVKIGTRTRPHKSKMVQRRRSQNKKGSNTLQRQIVLLWSSSWKSILPRRLRTRAVRRSLDELATFAASFRRIDRRLNLFWIWRPVDRYNLWRYWLTFCGVPAMFDVV